MQVKAITVRGESERYAQRVGVAERLLQPVGDAVPVILRLDYRDRDVGLHAQDVVGSPRCAAAHEATTNDNAASRYRVLFADLSHFIPASPTQRWGDEFRAYITFAED